MSIYHICKIAADDFRVVPVTWLSYDNKSCKWPPYEDVQAVNKAIVRIDEPDSDWNDIEIYTIVISKDDYRSAKNAIEIIKKASNVGSEVDDMLKKSRLKCHKKKGI